jgi:uncharacterized protein YkwD
MKKRNKITKAGKKVIKIRLSFVILICLLIILPVLFSVFLFYIVLSKPKPLSYLPIPKISQVYLPPPLELPTYVASVLGTQVITPDDLVKYINIEREKTGAKPLRISKLLNEAAQMRADVILKYQNFSHQDPNENIELLTVLPKVNYRYSYASENIGMGGLSAESFVVGFMNSTLHRQNLLDSNLVDTGAAIVTGPYKQYYVNIAVQLFAIPGGREEYLGYSFDDTKKYEEQLKELNAELNPVIWFANKTIGNKLYTTERFNKLARQKELLLEVYNVMKEEKPLQSNHVASIIEYNNNLNSI